MSRAALRSALPVSFVAGPTGRLAVLDVAAPAGAPARPAVLLSPGFTGSKEDLDPVLLPLAALGHRVVALDLRGQFESDGPAEPADPATYAPPAVAGDLAAVVAALGLGRPHLVGHSYGGLVARAAVLADPAAWSSLTLLDSGPAAVDGARATSTQLLVAGARAVTMTELWAAVSAYQVSQGHPEPVGDAAAFATERFTRSTPGSVIGMGEALVAEPDRVDALRATGVATAVVWGEHDDAWSPAEQAAMATRLGARAVQIPGAVHSPAVETPDALVRVLEDFFVAVERAG